jgi:hypothetical protein
MKMVYTLNRYMKRISKKKKNQENRNDSAVMLCNLVVYVIYHRRGSDMSVNIILSQIWAFFHRLSDMSVNSSA